MANICKSPINAVNYDKRKVLGCSNRNSQASQGNTLGPKGKGSGIGALASPIHRRCTPGGEAGPNLCGYTDKTW